MNNLLEPASLLKGIYDSALDYGIFTIDNEGKVTTWNSGATLITGFSAAEMTGQDFALIFTPEDNENGVSRREMHMATATGRAADYRWHMRKNGTRFWADGVLTPIHDDAESQIGYLKILRDITEKKLAEAEILRLATFDNLTGLANRHAFNERFASMAARALRIEQPMALHLIDLDHFKQVNDTLGHRIGDELLAQAAKRMRDVLRDSDFIARLGGDEFVLLQPDMPSAQAGADLANRLLGVLSRPFNIDSHDIQIGCSIGIAVCPNDAKSPDELLTKADLALYRAKEEGRGGFHYFTDNLDAEAHKRSRDHSELRHAVELQQFKLEYQPKVACADGHTVGLEALLRCTNPVLSSYPIEEIIDLAIEVNLIQKITIWVLQEACAQMRRWKNMGLSQLHVCVNLCSKDLIDSKITAWINSTINEYGLQPHNIEIELTERQAIDVEKGGTAILATLHLQGIHIALDDFGTGFSALSCLRNLPIDSLKLDKNFLSNIPDDPDGCAVARAVIDLAHALGLEVIAEGVETNEQVEFLKQTGCNLLQGFLICKPLPPEHMTSWLMQHT